MQPLNLIVGNKQPIDTLSKDIVRWQICKGRLASFFVFFNRISYYCGYVPPEDMPYITSKPADPAHLDIKRRYWKLELPDDHAFNKFGLVVPFFSGDPYVPMSQAVLEKIEDGFNAVRGERWLCHPELLKSDFVVSRQHPLSAVASVEFLEGLLCPPDDVAIEEVLNYREKYEGEREAFFDALREVSEAVFVSGRQVSVEIDMARVRGAIADLNRSMPARWLSGVRRSFEFGIRLDETTVGAIAAASIENANDLSAAFHIGTVLVGTIKISVDLVPNIAHDPFTKAMTYALKAKSTIV